ncbi:MAG: Glucose-1-phosphate adenylyltransferase [candidate division BRC1 bacterium ADurb.BinA364]|nr:MAG: Glucose-1-phosphate adenylyltransferase [candidate division BRC1 bacterium ADurb.BinA364]
MHSNLPFVGILTQYRPYSLMDHLSRLESWGYSGRGRMASILPPYSAQNDASWYAGTADAIYQNLSFIQRFDCDKTLVLSGDHIYHMNYGELLQFHVDHDADLTVACQPVPWEETRQFGVMKIDVGERIVDFQEKPKNDPISNLASLGIYVFRRSRLEERLRADAADKSSSHDFGNDIIPRMIREDRVYCYQFHDYWRDVGTLQSYWDAHMEALDPRGGLRLDRWDVRTNTQPYLPISHRPARIGPCGALKGSLASNGCIVDGRVERSVLSPGVVVRKGAYVADSVVLSGCVIGENAQVRKAIVDKRTIIGAGAAIGEGENLPNARHPHLLSCGLTVIGKEARLPRGIRIGRNCFIASGARESSFASDVPSGSCVD